MDGADRRRVARRRDLARGRPRPGATRPPRPRSRRSRTSSPRSAGSAPTRGCGPAQRVPARLGRARRRPARRARAADPVAAPARARRTTGFAPTASLPVRRRHGRARPVRHDRRRRRADPADQGPRRGARRSGAGRRRSSANAAFLAKAPEPVVAKIRDAAGRGRGRHRPDHRRSSPRCRRRDRPTRPSRTGPTWPGSRPSCGTGGRSPGWTRRWTGSGRWSTCSATRSAATR